MLHVFLFTPIFFKYSGKCHFLFIPAILFPLHPISTTFLLPLYLTNLFSFWLNLPIFLLYKWAYTYIYFFISSPYMNGSIPQIVFVAFLFSAFPGNHFYQFIDIFLTFSQLHGILLSVHMPNILIQWLSYVWIFRLFPVLCNYKYSAVKNLVLFSFHVISGLSSG